MGRERAGKAEDDSAKLDVMAFLIAEAGDTVDMKLFCTEATDLNFSTKARCSDYLQKKALRVFAKPHADPSQLNGLR